MTAYVTAAADQSDIDFNRTNTTQFSHILEAFCRVHSHSSDNFIVPTYVCSPEREWRSTQNSCACFRYYILRRMSSDSGKSKPVGCTAEVEELTPEQREMQEMYHNFRHLYGRLPSKSLSLREVRSMISAGFSHEVLE